MIDRDEVRDQIAHAMGWTTGHFGDVLDAVMAVVDPIVAERDDYRANGKEAAKVAFGVSEKLATVEAELAETHAAHRAALLGVSRPGQPTYEALEEHVAGLVQENGVLRGELESFVEASLEECDYTSDSESGGWEPDDYERAKANIAEMHRVLLVRLERLFQMQDQETAERESRFRWAEEAARLQAEVDRAFVFPHDWQEQIATEGTSCCGDSEAVIELLTNWRVDQFRKDAQKEPSDAQ